ncbi:MAG: glycosyltransferase, partial [Rhodospirillales bacterium]
ALKPAPIQMTWLGFPGTTGANYIDYILTDEIVTPEEHQPFYAEKPIWLQGCYLAGDPTMLDIPEPTPRKTLGLAEDAVVLASLNSPFKLTPDLMDTWLAILAADDRCQLWLRAGAASMQANLRARAEAAAINPDRIVFAGHVDTKADHMARLQAADIALDPFIYNGHTTSLDCLMAGLAVVTKPGGHFASRVTLSQLTQVGLAEELAVDTVEAYRAKVLELAAAPARAKALGAKARQALQAGALCLNADFARQLETAYEAAWAAFKDGKSPRPIAL